jgi:hypothetical protein
MNIKYRATGTKDGFGVSIDLTGAEVAAAIDAYLVAHGIYINGPRTITVNDALCEVGHIYVDPSGSVLQNGKRLSPGGVMIG